MIYLLIKVGVNKALIVIKSILRTLKIRYLRGGTRFESRPMHVVNILIFFYFIYLYVIRSIILYLLFHVVYEIHYDNVDQTEEDKGDNPEHGASLVQPVVPDLLLD